MNPVEYIGLAASLFIVASMCFPTHTKKATLMLRILNLIGSAVFLAYGILLPAISTAVLNGVNVIVNTVQLVLLLVKKPQDEENAAADNQEATDFAVLKACNDASLDGESDKEQGADEKDEQCENEENSSLE